MPRPRPDNDTIRRIATEYALECKAARKKPAWTEISQRLGMSDRWLTGKPNPAALLAKSIILKAWIAVGTAKPESRLGHTFTADRPEADIPAEYPKGDDLYGLLNHPERLKLFCSLIETAGLGGALQYTQITYKNLYAQQQAQQPQSTHA